MTDPGASFTDRRPSSLDTVAAQYDREAGRDFRELTRNATAQLVQNVQRQKSASGSKARLTLAEKTRRDGVERHLYRRWSSGEAYSPHDLSSTEAVKARRRKVQDQDAWDVLGIEEHDVYKVRSRVLSNMAIGEVRS